MKEKIIQVISTIAISVSILGYSIKTVNTYNKVNAKISNNAVTPIYYGVKKYDERSESNEYCIEFISTNFRNIDISYLLNENLVTKKLYNTLYKTGNISGKEITQMSQDSKTNYRYILIDGDIYTEKGGETFLKCLFTTDSNQTEVASVNHSNNNENETSINNETPSQSSSFKPYYTEIRYIPEDETSSFEPSKYTRNGYNFVNLEVLDAVVSKPYTDLDKLNISYTINDGEVSYTLVK